MFLEFLNETRVFHESEAMADALRLQGYCIVEVGVLRIRRAASVKQCLTSVKHEGYVQIQFFARFSERKELFLIKPYVVRPVFSSYKIET
jgi:hypothetical protein